MNKNCPGCFSEKTTHNKTFSSMLDLIGNSNQEVHVCNICNLKFLSPYFSEQELDELYSKSYFVDSESSDGSLGASSAVDYESISLAPRRYKYLNCLDILLSKKSDAKNILDIGAATGFFLYLAKTKKNLEIEGLETSKYACDEAKDKYNINLHYCALEEYEQNKTFDLIHLNHVFEHLVDPNESIKILDRLLSHKGLLYIEIPYQFNIFENIKYKITKKSKQYDIFSIHHPIFYTTKTFKKLFKKHGFEIVFLLNFDKKTYPNETMVQKLKILSWYFLSFFQTGTYIEAILKKK